MMGTMYKCRKSERRQNSNETTLKAKTSHEFQGQVLQLATFPPLWPKSGLSRMKVGLYKFAKNTKVGNHTANTYSCFVQNEKIKAHIIKARRKKNNREEPQQLRENDKLSNLKLIEGGWWGMKGELSAPISCPA